MSRVFSEKQKKEAKTSQDVAEELRRHLEDASILERAEELSTRSDARKVAEVALARLMKCGTAPVGSVTLEFPGGEELVLGREQCRARFCPRCGARRGRLLAEETSGALRLVDGWGFRGDRLRFATFTIPNSENVEIAMDALSAAWKKVTASKTFGALVAGGVRCFEAKPGRDGRWNVHLHALVVLWRAGTPYSLLRKIWDRAAGGEFNQRFDLLRDRVKRGKAAGMGAADAAARYVTKYLAKVDDMDGAERMPGGLPHLLAALNGRRLFGAWGVMSVARAFYRREWPEWTKRITAARVGYRSNGVRASRAVMSTQWGESWGVPVPDIPGPAWLDSVPSGGLSPDVLPRSVRERAAVASIDSPFRSYEAELLPSCRWPKEVLDAFAAGRPFSLLRTKAVFQRPRVIRWRVWSRSAVWRWTTWACETLGAAFEHLVSPEVPPDSKTVAKLVAVRLVTAYRSGLKLLRERLWNAHETEERRKILESARFPWLQAPFRQLAEV